jgi:hypothetical protein
MEVVPALLIFQTDGSTAEIAHDMVPGCADT